MGRVLGKRKSVRFHLVAQKINVLFCLSAAESHSIHRQTKPHSSHHWKTLAEAEIDRDPSLLSRERGKAATLMQGAVDRSDVYKSVELSLDRLLAEHLGHVEATFREIRRAEVGEEVASEEQKRGNKTDEEYAAEADSRREAREEQKRKDEARKRREEEKEALKAEEAKKKAELEKLRRREERRKEEEAKAAKRAKDREANRAMIKKAEEDEQKRKTGAPREAGAGRS